MSNDPSHSHNRHQMAPWNLIGIPEFFPRRVPQHAHLSNEHPLLHQSTWHSPTTDTMKCLTQPSNFGMRQVLENRPLQAPGVDLTVTSLKNGETSTTPISLSVRDTKKINSLTSIETQAVELTKSKDESVDIIKELEKPHDVKKRSKPLNSVLERLNPNLAKNNLSISANKTLDQSLLSEPLTIQTESVIVNHPSQDESSSSSSITNIQNVNNKEDEAISPYSNEDSLDSSKSRRKRKPVKTVRCSKSEEIINVTKPPMQKLPEEVVDDKAPDVVDGNVPSNDNAESQHKSELEQETIDNIAAMVQDGLKEKQKEPIVENVENAVSESVKTKELVENPDETPAESPKTIVTPAQKKETHFVEVENKLEEMFAGIEDTATTDPLAKSPEVQETLDFDPLVNGLEGPSNAQDKVSSTSSENVPKKITKKKRKSKGAVENSSEKPNPKRAKTTKPDPKDKKGKQKVEIAKLESIRDVCVDSGSNASSTKSRGPFIHIKGPRSSPFSVTVVNAPAANDEDGQPKGKSKKFHDDYEYRHKIRSKGLHCSTLSNKYDAQTKDVTWICVFCKKGPHTYATGNDTFPTGDLFGPYFISSECNEIDDKLENPYDRQFKSKKISKALEAVKPIEAAKLNKKSKRKYSEGSADGNEDLYFGFNKTDNKMYEVWVHEECIVWSPGVYLVGTKIVGLEDAVWTACNINCIKCNLKGANICCFHRGCVKVAHVWCAKALRWLFEEESFKTLCPQHRT